MILKLNLKNNNINKIQDYSFYELAVTEINLENNNLFAINFKSFIYNSNYYFPLKILNLKKNPIKYISVEFIYSQIFENLIEFYLDNNQLIDSSIQTSYTDNNHLKKTINESYFKDMLNLKSIQLNSDQIESIERNTFNKLKYLKTLSLKNNKLKNIYDFYFEKLFNLNELYLSNNI